MLGKSDFRYFLQAAQVASVSDFIKTHVGCVAVYQGNIIGLGCNKTHPMQAKYNRYHLVNYRNIYLAPKIHAEIKCLNSIRYLKINFSKVKLYIYRVRNEQAYGMSRPCPSCMVAICVLGIRQPYLLYD